MKFRYIFMTFLCVFLTACSQHDHSHSHNHDHHHSQDGNRSTTPSQIQTVWSFSSQTLEHNRNEEITIQIKDSAGNPIETFEISHEKLMHLIVVSKDLSYFHHLHPEYAGNGEFKVTTLFPQGGDYKLFADFVLQGADQRTESQWISVKGDVPNQSDLQPDSNLTKVMEGKEITLSFDRTVKAGEQANMTFSFKDARTKQPITPLEPYLGAIGHVVILSENAEHYLHVHPMETDTTAPVAKFLTTFPYSGVYKIWGQFQYKGDVFTVPFIVKVD